MRVFVYRNLHKKMFSIRAMEGPNKGKVIGWEHDVVLRDAYFKVSEAGRQRVIRENRKNVHAGIVGTIADSKGGIYKWSATAYYNPFEMNFFCDRESGLSLNGETFDLIDITSDNGVNCYNRES